MTTQRFAFIINPEAGGGRGHQLKPLLEYRLRRQNVPHDIHETISVNHTREIIRSLPRQVIIVSVGGDGTMNNILNALGSEAQGRIFGLIPCGRANSLARTSGIPRNLSRALRVLLRGEAKTVDLGRVNGHLFINGVGIGFDGRLNLEQRAVSNLEGPLFYAVSFSRSWRRFRPLDISLNLDGRAFHTKVYQLAVGNGSYIDGGFRLTPDARPDDGLLDVAWLEPIPRRRILMRLHRLRDGKITKIPGVGLQQASRVETRSNESLPVLADGEPLEFDGNSVTIDILPAAVKVIGNWPN